jgi:hypothetical protein
VFVDGGWFRRIDCIQLLSRIAWAMLGDEFSDRPRDQACSGDSEFSRERVSAYNNLMG